RADPARASRRNGGQICIGSRSRGHALEDEQISAERHSICPAIHTAPTPATFAPTDGVLAVRTMPRRSLTGVPGASEAQ
ncbi:MAG TPA: hypothetical protein VF469_12585, partial [Kofleriaceae bacterium]